MGALQEGCSNDSFLIPDAKNAIFVTVLQCSSFSLPDLQCKARNSKYCFPFRK